MWNANFMGYAVSSAVEKVVPLLVKTPRFMPMMGAYSWAKIIEVLHGLSVMGQEGPFWPVRPVCAGLMDRESKPAF